MAATSHPAIEFAASRGAGGTVANPGRRGLECAAVSGAAGIEPFDWLCGRRLPPGMAVTSHPAIEFAASRGVGGTVANPGCWGLECAPVSGAAGIEPFDWLCGRRLPPGMAVTSHPAIEFAASRGVGGTVANPGRWGLECAPVSGAAWIEPV